MTDLLFAPHLDAEIERLRLISVEEHGECMWPFGISDAARKAHSDRQLSASNIFLHPLRTWHALKARDGYGGDAYDREVDRKDRVRFERWHRAEAAYEALRNFRDQMKERGQ